jgi:hypothetical protein
MTSFNYLLFGTFFMCKSSIPTLSYVFNKFKLNIQIPDPNNQPKFRRLYNDYEGMDQRYPGLNNTIISDLKISDLKISDLKISDSNEIAQIKANFYKLDLVKKLKSDKINSHDKLNLIKTSNVDCLNNLSDKIKPINIKSGGLYKDWDFNMD